VSVPIKTIEYIEKWITKGESYAYTKDSFEVNPTLPSMYDYTEPIAIRNKEHTAPRLSISEGLEVNPTMPTIYDFPEPAEVRSPTANVAPRASVSDGFEASPTLPTVTDLTTEPATITVRKSP